MKIHILYGLPGSGKSTWAKNRENEGWYHIDADREFNAEKIAEKIRRIKHQNYEHVILDTLVINTQQLKKLVKSIKVKNPKDSIVVEFWKKNIAACLLNDGQRPCDRSGAATIKHLGAQYVKPNKKTLEKLNVELNEHEVVSNKQLLAWKKKYEEYVYYGNNDNPQYLYSNSWVTGGREWNYTGDEWDASVQEQPTEFKALDELLENECPQISFLEYKKIWRETVDVENYTDRDYYHDLCLSRYRCDLIKLYNILNEQKNKSAHSTAKNVE